MFDLSKLTIYPNSGNGFNPAATHAEIEELTQYFGDVLPKNYTEILKKYNGGYPELSYFDVDELTYTLAYFFSLGETKDSSINIWWAIHSLSKITGAGTLPFASSGIDEIYFLKPVNGQMEIWILRYDELKEPKMDFVIGSFDALLNALYVRELNSSYFEKKHNHAGISYTRLMFANELKEKVKNNLEASKIGKWAFNVYMDSSSGDDDEFLNVLLTLTYMESGDEFAFSWKRLNEIADDLIAGRPVDLDY
jgi:hypothetical protein